MLENKPSSGRQLRQERRHSRLNARQVRFGLLVLLPVMIYMIIFVIVPVIAAAINSVFNTSRDIFVGFRNYRDFLFVDPNGVISLRNTFVYALIRIPATMIFGFMIANALDKVRVARGPMIFLYFAPNVTNMVAFSAIFLYLYSNSGLFNALLQGVGLPSLEFTRSPEQALPSVALMDAWEHIGFDTVVYLAALQGIPRTLYEAAHLDGASAPQIVRLIKIPLLRPTILYLAVVLFIWTMQVFDPIYMMTQGGPVNSTRTIVFQLYQQAFEQIRIGYASAIAFIEFAIVLLVTLIQLRIGRTTWSY